MRSNEFVLLKDIALGEAERGTRYARQISKEFKGMGYEKIGSGVDSTIWAKDSDYVIKILMPDEPGSQAERIFKKFYEFCEEHPNVNCLPIFNEYNKIPILDKEYTQIDMERLFPIRRNTFEESMVWALSDYTLKNRPWKEVVIELCEPEAWKNLNSRIARSMATLVKSQLKNKQFQYTYSQLYEVMRLLYHTGQINKFGWDLHTENVMQRKDGTLVIIDPWFSIAEKRK